MGSDRSDDPRRWPDGVEVQPVAPEVLADYRTARAQLSQFQAPILAGESRPDGRVFVAAFDGTGNDKDQFPDTATNVADIYDQVDRARLSDVQAGYQTGVGTQADDVARGLDKGLGYSYGPRMEQMYYDLCVQARAWRNDNPDAEISVAAIGFSRGAVTAALFTRMVEKRGIQDPEHLVVLERDAEGRVAKTLPLPSPPLVPPGQTPQVVGLFDPVATGAMNQMDVRLPPSVVSGFQITALHEWRDQFQSKQIIDPGMSSDGRFLNVQVGGAHSDIGGSYLLNGLSIRNGNLMAAYLNTLSDRPFLQDRPVPTAVEMNVIHNSLQHEWFYTSAGVGAAGERLANERLTAPPVHPAHDMYQRVFSSADDAEPRNEALNRPLRYRHIPVPPEREDPRLPEFFSDRPQPEREPARMTPSAPLPGLGTPRDASLRSRPGDPLHEIQEYGRQFQPQSPEQNGAGAPIRMAEPAAPPSRASGLRPFDDPRHSQHALHTELTAALPDYTSPDRLAQFTAACHSAGIGIRNLAAMDIDSQRAVFESHGGWPRAVVDMSRPPPPMQESLQRVEDIEQQRQAQEQERQLQAQQSPEQMRAGPVHSLGP